MTEGADMSNADEVVSGVAKVRVWIVAPDANGSPTITRWDVGVTELEMEHGYHYDRACKLALDQGYGVQMVAFDEQDPAGKQMLSLMEMQSIAKQVSVPGPLEAPEWMVAVTIDATMSARIRVRATSQEEAIDVARNFVANEGGAELLSLDEGNYRGISDYYCGDPLGVEQVEDLVGV
jgi:hypothetical protein